MTAECNEVTDMYDPQLWPEGIYVHRYFEAHKAKDDSRQGREAGTQQQCSLTVPIAMGAQGSSSQAGTNLNK